MWVRMESACGNSLCRGSDVKKGIRKSSQLGVEIGFYRVFRPVKKDISMGGTQNRELESKCGEEDVYAHKSTAWGVMSEPKHDEEGVSSDNQPCMECGEFQV